MCIVFRETEYHSGFVVAIPQDVGVRELHILMTKCLKNSPYKYSGICLDNGLQVTTDEREKHMALFDLIGKIVSSTIGTEKEHARKYPNEVFQPFDNIFEEDHALRKTFLRKKRNFYSFSIYHSVHKIFERPNIVSGKSTSIGKKIARTVRTKLLVAGTILSILPNLLPVVYDCKDIALASNKVREDTLLKGATINYGRA